MESKIRELWMKLQLRASQSEHDKLIDDARFRHAQAEAKNNLDSCTSQASNFRRVLGCPGSPRFHFQKPVWWLPMTGGHRGGDLQLQFPGPMAVSASADGRVPGF